MPIAQSKSNLQPRRARFKTILFSLALFVVAAVAGIQVGRHFNHRFSDARPTGIQFTPGQQLTYHVDFNSTSFSNVSSLFSASSATSSDASEVSPLGLTHLFQPALQANLECTAIQADGNGVVLACQFLNPQVHFQAEGLDLPEQSKQIQSGLALPMFCLLDAHGRVQSVWFNAAATPLIQRIASAIFAGLQVVNPLPGANSVTQWDAEEEDPSGKLLAHYQVQSDGTIHKTKTQYLPDTTAKKTRTIQLIPLIQSQGEYVDTLDGEGNLVSVAAAEAQTVTIQNKEVGHGTLQLDVSLLRKQEATPDQLERLQSAYADLRNSVRAIPLYDPTPQQQAEQNIQRQALGADTLDSLLAALAAAEAAPPQENEIMQLFLKFKALAYVHPEACAQLGQLLTDAKTGGLRMQILSDALQAAGNPQAQAALCTAILARSSEINANRVLIPALGYVESPTPETVEALQWLAFGMFDKAVTSTARLALGSAARNVADDSPSRAAKIVDRILQELNQANPADAWELLLALGNAGSTEALPTLQNYLANPDPQLRGAAAWAMRWIDSPQVDPLLTKVLLDDPQATARLEAVRAFRFREKSAANLAVQASALAKDADPEVRVELLNNVWEARPSFPQARQLVEKAAADDPSEDVRKAAAKLLEDAKVKQ
ncbi:MAG TPA: HEAT repeat domain-containing protein [Pirellulales bacterium]|nr:HEAT repeat domain-containing protein [Pirellulales bacterium]